MIIANDTASCEYDANNNLTSVKDANNNATMYKMDAKGVTISYVYDALNRLTKIDFSTDTDIVYVYDTCVNGKGQLCSMTDASGITNYEWTPKGQVKKETKTIDSVRCD